MAEKAKPKTILLKQPAMRRVLLALLPCVAGGIYFFGWRSLFLIVWAAIIGFVVEHIFTRRRREPVSEAVFVTTTLFALVMPPTVPLHVLTIGVVFAVMFTKELFGGFGRNIFNPALAGRCFVYICFPVALTATWAPAAGSPWGALNLWTTASSPDAVTGATPLAHLKAGKIASGKGRAQRIVCLSNLKQLTTWIAYADQYDGRLVSGLSFGYRKRPRWMEEKAARMGERAFRSRGETCSRTLTRALWPYVRDIDVYRCPAGADNPVTAIPHPGRRQQ